MAIANAINNILRAGTAFLLGSDAPGDLYFRGTGTDGAVQRLPVGAPNQVLMARSAGTGQPVLPVWASGGLINWSIVTGTTQAAAINNGYLTNNAALVTVTLPITSPVGSIIEIVGLAAGGWRLAQNAGQTVYFGSINSTAGTAGRLDSTHQRDSIRLLCIGTDTAWQVISSIGNIDVV